MQVNLWLQRFAKQRHRYQLIIRIYHGGMLGYWLISFLYLITSCGLRYYNDTISTTYINQLVLRIGLIVMVGLILWLINIWFDVDNWLIRWCNHKVSDDICDQVTAQYVDNQRRLLEIHAHMQHQADELVGQKVVQTDQWVRDRSRFLHQKQTLQRHNAQLLNFSHYLGIQLSDYKIEEGL